jgi:hypothetical protein
VVSATDPPGRILGFLDRSRYYFFQVAPQLYSRGWVDPVPGPLPQKIWKRRESKILIDIRMKNSYHAIHENSPCVTTYWRIIDSIQHSAFCCVKWNLHYRHTNNFRTVGNPNPRYATNTTNSQQWLIYHFISRKDITTKNLSIKVHFITNLQMNHRLRKWWFLSSIN